MQYQTGFASHLENEALKGALPLGQNSPKKAPYGLIPEQLTGSAFTRARHQNLRSWLYRIRPSTLHGPFSEYTQCHWHTQAETLGARPEPLRWQPLAPPDKDCDFIDGVRSMVVTETPGGAVHHYHCNSSMEDRYFYNADGELMILPERGRLLIHTEFGPMELEPQEMAVVPRGVKFQVELVDEGWSRGYLGENLGEPFVLPDLGPLGANALALPRDFHYPCAHYVNEERECQVVLKFGHRLWSYGQEHSPLDVVAWHGNYAPYKYDLRRFNTMGTVSFDHPDPSIYTVLTSPSTIPGQANLDFVIFPPRWLVGENTFRPPYYHRNIMSEYMGLIHGNYDAKLEGGFVPGGASLHNAMTPHGPDTTTFYKGVEGPEVPQKITDTMAFMFETCHRYVPTEFALKTKSLDKDYLSCWRGFKPLFSEED